MLPAQRPASPEIAESPSVTTLGVPEPGPSARAGGGEGEQEGDGGEEGAHPAILSAPALWRQARWFAISSLTRVGRSTAARWAAGSTVSSRAPGIEAAISALVLGRRRLVAGAGDDERRRRDAPELVAQVHALDRPAGRRRSRLGIGGDQHRAQLGSQLRVLLGVGGREPARHDRVGDDPDRARRAHLRRALRPALGGRKVRGGADEDEPLDPLGRVRAQPHADHSADREPAVRRALDLQRVHQLEHVAAEVGDLVGPVRAPASARGRGGRSGRSAAARRARAGCPTCPWTCRASCP